VNISIQKRINSVARAVEKRFKTKITELEALIQTLKNQVNSKDIRMAKIEEVYWDVWRQRNDFRESEYYAREEIEQLKSELREIKKTRKS